MRHAQARAAAVTAAAMGFFGWWPAAFGQAEGGAAEEMKKLKARVSQLEEETEMLHKEVAALKAQMAAVRQAAAAGGAAPADAEAAGLVRSRLRANQANAGASLKQLVTHESVLRVMDADKNGVADYWTRDVAALYCLHDADGKPIAFIDPAFARADAAPGKAYRELGGAAKAKLGYFYKALKTDQDGKPYLDKEAPASSAENAPEGVSTHRSRFAFCAFPAKHGTDGKATFVVNESGVVWQKDLGPEAKGVEAWPNPEESDSGWEQFDR